jgi:hypothetical protein
MENDMRLTAEVLRGMKCNIFATRDDIEEVIDGSSDTLSVMIALNTVLETLAKLAETDSQVTATELRAELAEREGGGE